MTTSIFSQSVSMAERCAANSDVVALGDEGLEAALGPGGDRGRAASSAAPPRSRSRACAGEAQALDLDRLALTELQLPDRLDGLMQGAQLTRRRASDPTRAWASAISMPSSFVRDRSLFPQGCQHGPRGPRREHVEVLGRVQRIAPVRYYAAVDARHDEDAARKMRALKVQRSAQRPRLQWLTKRSMPNSSVEPVVA